MIGSATNNQSYILVECSPPWMPEAFDSKWIPENLKVLVKEVKSAKLPIKFLLIANNISHQVDSTTLLIYQREEGLVKKYRQQEFKLRNIQQVAAVVRQWLAGKTPECELATSATRDIVVCTHGSHDQCCARYGNPFYAQAVATVSNLGLNTVRMWKSSHFGGHRFAPTIIDLPEGRYYGALELESFKSILSRTGDLQCLNKIYRGWGILPNPIQILERELIFRYGWDWFSYKVTGKIIEHLDNHCIQAEIAFEKPDGSLYIYQANIVKDDAKTLKIKGSCTAKQESVFIKYSVVSLRLTSQKSSDPQLPHYLLPSHDLS